jgi:hypothetical protein
MLADLPERGGSGGIWGQGSEKDRTRKDEGSRTHGRIMDWQNHGNKLQNRVSRRKQALVALKFEPPDLGCHGLRGGR